MEIDINKALRNALSTGKVVIGTKQTIDAVNSGKAQVVVVSSSCPAKTMNEIKGIPVIKYPGSVVDLGIACGKQFSIAALAVLETGESDILSLGNKNV